MTPTLGLTGSDSARKLAGSGPALEVLELELWELRSWMSSVKRDKIEKSDDMEAPFFTSVSN
jgi:hypothetical protein